MASFKQLEKENWQVSFYCKDYLGNNKKIKKQGFKTKKLASEYVQDYIALNSGSSNIFFNTAFEEFLNYKSKHIRKNTLKNYVSIYNKYIKNYFKDIELKNVDEFFISKFLLSIELALVAKKVKVYLTSFFKYASIFFGYKQNPINQNLELKKHTKKDIEILTFEEFKKFNEIIKNENLKIITYFNLLYFTGARCGEISALTLKDIDFKNKTININKTRISLNEVNKPKTKSSNRIISLPVSTFEMLKKYIDSIPTNDNLFLFSSPSYYIYFLNNLSKKQKFKKIHLHLFRHSHASLLIKKGIPITDISKRLGHSNPQITLQVYSKFYNENTDNITNLLNELV